MKNLLELRDEIDVIDKQIVALYQQRMQIAGEVAEYKIETGKKVFDKDREMEKLATLSALGDSAFNRHGIRELFEQIMSISRKRQYQLMTEHGIYEKPDFEELDALDYKNARIVFQGTEGAYTQLALKQYFGEDAGNSYHVETWRDAMEAIASGDADYAVLPIENSSAGIVSENYDLMVEYGHCIVGEQIIKIEHALLGVPGAKLSDICRKERSAFRYHGCILASAGTDAVCEILRRASGVGEAQLKKYRDGGTESQGGRYAAQSCHCKPSYGGDLRS